MLSSVLENSRCNGMCSTDYDDEILRMLQGFGRYVLYSHMYTVYKYMCVCIHICKETHYIVHQHRYTAMKFENLIRFVFIYFFYF